ncbi:DUF3077 domain-containing protein [Cupriavidus metallidurans]|uniref:DUF3077 domain-containing protein n=1 Tax=Cupriavidus metallidurans TaxID=119219 RepID=UPI00055A6BF6|nr:DUF3077 domain-containing protein [Cupriavidus metallidurans]
MPKLAVAAQFEQSVSTVSPNARIRDDQSTFASSFYRVNGQGTNLFEVRAGLSTTDALEAASTLMESALAILAQVAGDADNPKAWGAHALFESAKAVVDAYIMAPENYVKPKNLAPEQ